MLSVVILSSSMLVVNAKGNNSDLATAIKLYKIQNYTECYSMLAKVLKKDPTNALAYYYMAMTATQVGNEREAIDNYEKAITLSAPNSNLNRYATRGKLCIEDSAACNEANMTTVIEDLMKNKKGSNLSDEVRSNYEQLKLENLMREINRKDDVDLQKFREYKDFSSMNFEGTPSNDEIVAAIRTLQRAGLGNMFANNYSSDIAMLTGSNNQQNAMLNMMGSSLNPQVMQALLTNNMSLGF